MFKKLAFFTLFLAFTCFLASCGKISAGTPCTTCRVGAKPKTAPKAPQTEIRFDKFAAGTLPEGFTAALTHEGQPGKWEILDYKGAKVLAQTSTDATEGRYPLCIYDNAVFKNGEVSVDFLAVSGKVDQAAGIVVRYKDKVNYYMTRANALENNLRLYKIESGKRIQLASENLKISAGRWHNLKFEIQGILLNVFYDGKPVLKAVDSTFQEPGKIGLWTKADSVTYFKNLAITTEK